VDGGEGLGGVVLSLRRHAAHVDTNHREIVNGLLARGCSVLVLSKKGVPDLLVGHGERNFLIELKREEYEEEKKDGYTRKNRRPRLNEEQARFHAYWKGHVDVAWTLEEALRIVGLAP
jgi:hypothetical protein